MPEWLPAVSAAPAGDVTVLVFHFTTEAPAGADVTEKILAERYALL